MSASSSMPGKVKKFSSPTIRKISGGKDPLRIVTDFILRRAVDPDTVEREKSQDFIRWVIPTSEGEELEILLEGLKYPGETTIYLGLPIATVPLKGLQEFILTCLEVADGLVGTKISLVASTLVLSATLAASGSSVEELEYHFNLLVGQQSWFRNELAEAYSWGEE